MAVEESHGQLVFHAITIYEKLPEKGGKTLEQAAQGCGGITISRGAQQSVQQNVALQDTVTGHGSDGLTAGLDDHRGLF